MFNPSRHLACATDEKIREQVPQKDLIVMGSNLPDVYWKDFGMSMNDTGLGVKFVFDMENPVSSAPYFDNNALRRTLDYGDS